MSDIEQRLREAMDGVEEGLRLAEVGEYLYNECAYSYGDGRTEPREYGIEWQWQQAKSDEYGQGQLLAASTKWHAEQAADGIGTEATKLRDTIAALRKQVSDAVGALEPFSDFAGELFARNYNKTDKVASVKGVTAFGNELEVSLTFLAFLNARRTLASLREADHA